MGEAMTVKRRISKIAKTAAQTKVSDTARRRVEKLHAADAWDRLAGGPTSYYKRDEREQESARRAKRMAARRKRGG